MHDFLQTRMGAGCQCDVCLAQVGRGSPRLRGVLGEHLPSSSAVGRRYTAVPRTKDPAGTSQRPFVSWAEWCYLRSGHMERDPLGHQGLNTRQVPGRHGRLWSGMNWPSGDHVHCDDCLNSVVWDTSQRRRDWGITIFLPITNTVGL